MTPENFAYWLKGYFEILEVDKNKEHVGHSLSIEQVKCIKQHLDYVFQPMTVTSTGTLVGDDAKTGIAKVLSGLDLKGIDTRTVYC